MACDAARIPQAALLRATNLKQEKWMSSLPGHRPAPFPPMGSIALQLAVCTHTATAPFPSSPMAQTTL